MRAALAVFAANAAAAATNVEIHYAPQENLEHIDVDVIDNAASSIDIAAYVLSDAAVIQALCDAADRGVAIRIYLDKSEYSRHGPGEGGPIERLLAFPNVFARIKGRGVLMHLKAYAVDGERLRTGSGNFSRSGLEDQDNDLILIADPVAVAKFENDFGAMWSRGSNVEAATAPIRGR